MKLVLLYITLLITYLLVIAKRKLSDRVFGEEVKENIPFMVAIVVLEGNNKEALLACGATIITEYWTLTAATCLTYKMQLFMDIGLVKVRGNTSFYDCRDNTCNDHRVSRHFAHKEFMGEEGHYKNNIAVVKVFEPFHGVQERAVQLAPKIYRYIPKSLATGIGWGATDSEDPKESSKHLRYTRLRLMKFTRCKDIWGKKITTKVVCGKADTKGQDMCYGDAGGPLYQRKLQIGITSVTDKCSKHNTPALFTRVSNYSEWINETINEIDKVEQETGWV